MSPARPRNVVNLLNQRKVSLSLRKASQQNETLNRAVYFAQVCNQIQIDTWVPLSKNIYRNKNFDTPCSSQYWEKYPRDNLTNFLSSFVKLPLDMGVERDSITSWIQPLLKTLPIWLRNAHGKPKASCSSWLIEHFHTSEGFLQT